MTENPLYRRVYNANNPLWRTPSNEYPQINLNVNAAQDLRNLLGDFFARNYQSQYPNYYQPTTPYQMYSTQAPILTPAQQTAQKIYGDVADTAADFVKDQIVQNALLTAGIGTGAGTVLGVSGRAATPLVMATLNANSLTKPIANGLTKFGNTNAGKTLGKYADKIIDFFF